MICASLVLLQIMFAVHRFAQGATAPTALKVAVSPSRAMSFISRLRRSRQHRVSILPAYLVHPFPLRGTSPQGETRALRDLLSVSYGKITILLTGSLRSPPPIRLRRTSPRESVSHDSQVASLPYSTAITDSQYFARHCVPSKYVRWCDSCSLATPIQGAEQPVLCIEPLMRK